MATAPHDDAAAARRRARGVHALAFLLATAAVACLGPRGAADRSSLSDDEIETFACNERRASYMVAGGFAAAELGVQMECAHGGPSLTQWTVDDDGRREQARTPLGLGVFDDTWRTLEDAGWRNLHDCVARGAADDAPAYAFDISDDDTSASFACQGKQLPFPYDRLVDALDRAARTVR